MRRTFVLLSLFFAFTAAAADLLPASSREAIGVKPDPPAPHLASAAIAPAASLGVAESWMLEEIHQWNASGREPVKNGFTRTFPELVNVKVTNAVAAKAGATSYAGGLVAYSERGVVWSSTFKVDVDRVRLRLDNAKLPAGAVLWIYTEGQTPIAFDRDLLDADGGIWTPTVQGGLVHLEIEIPAPKSEDDAASFQVRRVLQLIAPSNQSIAKENDSPSCLIDVQCVSTTTLPQKDIISRAIAHLEYVKDGGGYVCSGGLLIDSTSSFTPYLLTANHCFDSAASASSLEAYWDYKFASCSSTTIPSLSGFQRSNGAALLATSATSDFTFVRLNSIPSNRGFLGWTTNPNATVSGTTLYRISHPFPDAAPVPLPQTFSTTTITTSGTTCNGVPRPQFLYSTAGQGGVYGGSSGSPVFTQAGQVVGQLLGACGPSPSDGCSGANKTVDGAFTTSFGSISQFLNSTPTTTCTPNANRVCLNNDRFGVQVAFTAGSTSGNATAIEYTPDSALFWFFSSTNIEMLLKILNACGLNSRYWVFAAATTDVEYTITVTDFKNGTSKSYFHAQGTPAPAITDTDAFATCP